MTNEKRLHRIGITLEYLLIWWLYLDDEKKLEILLQAVEDARNHEQVRLLHNEVIAKPILSDTLELLRQIQQSPTSSNRIYIAHLRIKIVDKLKDKVEDILDGTMETGRVREP